DDLGGPSDSKAVRGGAQPARCVGANADRHRAVGGPQRECVVAGIGVVAEHGDLRAFERKRALQWIEIERFHAGSFLGLWGRVTAPSDADDTSAAYLASTPCV